LIVLDCNFFLIARNRGHLSWLERSYVLFLLTDFILNWLETWSLVAKCFLFVWSYIWCIGLLSLIFIIDNIGLCIITFVVYCIVILLFSVVLLLCCLIVSHHNVLVVKYLLLTLSLELWFWKPLLVFNAIYLN